MNKQENADRVPTSRGWESPYIPILHKNPESHFTWCLCFESSSTLAPLLPTACTYLVQCFRMTCKKHTQGCHLHTHTGKRAQKQKSAWRTNVLHDARGQACMMPSQEFGLHTLICKRPQQRGSPSVGMPILAIRTSLHYVTTCRTMPALPLHMHICA